MFKELPLHYCPKYTIRFALRLRKQMTKAETLLWKALRRKQCEGMKFRRQVPIGEYIVDFLCVEQYLVIEIDGRIHEKQEYHDARREAFLRRRGYRIVRFRNEDILRNLSAVLDLIARSRK